MSTIVIAGGHGKIALRLARLLSARGDTVRSLIRNPGHSAGVHAAGAEPLVADMEELDSLAEFVEGADKTVPWPSPHTTAYGLRVPSPIGGFVCLLALRATHGTGVTVAEGAIAE